MPYRRYGGYKKKAYRSRRRMTLGQRIYRNGLRAGMRRRGPTIRRTYRRTR